MKRNKLLRAFSLADEKYVAEADPTKDKKKQKAPLIRKCVLAACLCLIMTACNIALFTPYDTTPPDVSQYSDSEYYPIIEKLNALTYQKPRYKSITAGSNLGRLRLEEIHINNNNADENTIKNLNISAEDGFNFAYYLLASVYLQGNCKIQKDEIKSFQYMKKAAELGVSEAIDFFDRMNESET